MAKAVANCNMNWFEKWFEKLMAWFLGPLILAIIGAAIGASFVGPVGAVFGVIIAIAWYFTNVDFNPK